MVDRAGYTFAPGDRVQWHERTLGSSFEYRDGKTRYQKSPSGQKAWTGTVIRDGVSLRMVWVQWDCLAPGTHRPVLI